MTNTTAERSTLGSILLDPSVWPTVSSIISESDLIDARHRILWRACQALLDKGLPIDLTTICNELDLRGEKAKCGGALYLGGLGDEVATSVHAEHYARQVKEQSIQRRLRASGAAIAADKSESVDDALTAAFDSVSSLVTEHHGQRSQIRPIRETIDAACDEAVSLEAPRGVVKTGIASVDAMTGGLWPGLLTVCAARTSMGKSMFAVANVAVNAALAGRKILLLTLEDTARFVQWRILSRLAKVPLDRIVRRALSDEQRHELNAKRELIGALPLWIDDSSHAKPEQIRQAAVNQINKTGCDLLIIDRLSFVIARGHSPYERTTEAVSQIAQIAKDLNIPVLLLHQLSRATLQNKGYVPTLGDLRDSGEIEQSARQILFLHRPYYYDRTENPFEFWVIVAKNSHGQTGTLKVSCLLENMYVYDERDERKGMQNDF